MVTHRDARKEGEGGGGGGWLVSHLMAGNEMGEGQTGNEQQWCRGADGRATDMAG